MTPERLALIDFWERLLGDRMKLAVTLTFKKYLRAYGQRLTERTVEKSVLWFLSRLNRLCYGNSAKRRGFCVGVATVLHKGGSGDNLHAHLALVAPLGMQYNEFKIRILKAATANDWIDRQCDIKPYQNKGWLKYMLHEGNEALIPSCNNKSNP